MNLHTVMLHTVLDEQLARRYYDLGELSVDFTCSDVLKAVHHLQAQQAKPIPLNLYSIVGVSRLSLIEGQFQLSQNMLPTDAGDQQHCDMLGDLIDAVMLPKHKWVSVDAAEDQRLIKHSLMRFGCEAPAYWQSFSAHRHAQHVDLPTLMKWPHEQALVGQNFDYHAMAAALGCRWQAAVTDEIQLQAYLQGKTEAWQQQAADNISTLMTALLQLYRSQAKLSASDHADLLTALTQRHFS